MNHKIKNLIISQKNIVILINKLFNLRYKKKYENIVLQRENIPIFEYNELTLDIPYAPEELVIDNNLYGIAHVLKEYIGIEPRKHYLDAYIEHGVFFGSLVRADQKLWPVKQNITFGEQRVMHLLNNEIRKEILAIGPFIHYAKILYDTNEMKKLKEKLGKTLLVFPSHSIKNVQSTFDVDSFINEIEIIKKDYDSVLLSLYWEDVKNKDLVSFYESKGYKIVTSGHRFDYNFLNRLKTIIELSDFTISNNVGTHVGYCIYMNKPHYIFRQKVQNVGKNAEAQKHFDAVRNTEEMNITYEKEVDEIFKCFSKLNDRISSEQYSVVNKYWGLDYVLSKDELKKKLIIK